MKRTQKQEAPKRRKKAYELRQRGQSWKEVASHMDCSIDAAQALARRHRELNSIPSPPNPFVQAFLKDDLDEWVERYRHVYGRSSINRLERQHAASQLRESGKSWKEIAEEVGSTPSGAHALAACFTPKKLRALRLLRKKAREREALLLKRIKSGQRIVQLREKQETWSDIALKMGVHRSSAQRYFHLVTVKPI